jgi:hypothetical protein
MLVNVPINKTPNKMVLTDSGGHGGERYAGCHGCTLRRSANANHLPCNVIDAQPSNLCHPLRVKPPVLLRQPALHREEWQAHPAEEDAILQHSHAIEIVHGHQVHVSPGG